MKSTFAMTLCLLLSLFSACAQKVNDPADVQAIKDTCPAFDKAWNAGNAQAVAAGIYTPDAIRMEPYSPALIGNDTIRASIQKYFDQFSEESRNVAEDVRVSGDLGIARGTYEGEASLKAGGYSAQFKGKWIAALQRQADGSWKVFWDIFNSDLPPADSLSPGAEELALLQIEREWADAVLTKNVAVLDSILAPEFVGHDAETTRNKQQALALLKSASTKVESGQNSDMKAFVFGDTAVVHGVWTEKGTSGGKDTSGQYRWTDIFEKRDGRWLCVGNYSKKVG